MAERRVQTAFSAEKHAGMPVMGAGGESLADGRRCRWMRSENVRLRRLVCGEAAAVTYDMGAGTRLRIVEGSEAHLAVHLCLEGEVELNRGDKALTLGGHSEAMSVARPGLEVLAKRRARGLFVIFPLKALDAKWKEGKRGGAAPALPALAVLQRDAGHALGQKLLANCLNAAYQQVCSGIEQLKLSPLMSLLPVLLLEVLGESPAAGERQGADATPWYIGVVERHIRENPANQICMKELATLVGLSPRTLHEGFRKHRGYSPMRYLREQRLKLIHKELAEPTAQTRVTDVVLKWGVNHLGRFSSYYAGYFGEKPSDTLHRGRLKVDENRYFPRTVAAG
ncbi:MAG: AraC family transcriptional regulator [Acidobacteria bacterium]|nr:AraC family transcriptional regulator [Acidobacteriota bacterium]